MSILLNLEPKKNFTDVVYTEEGKKMIWNVFKDLLSKRGNISGNVSSTEIWDILFSHVDSAHKSIGSYKIQVVLGRDYGGR